MKSILLIGIFAIVLPACGQEKGPQAPANAKHSQVSEQPSHNPTPPSISLADQKTANEQDNGSKRDLQGYFSRLFSPENLPNVGLFLAGVAGILVAIRTLRAIETQTSVLADSQRPKITASAAEDPAKTFADRLARRVVLELENKGLMPATNYVYESWIEVLPDTSGNFTNGADLSTIPPPSCIRAPPKRSTSR